MISRRSTFKAALGAAAATTLGAQPRRRRQGGQGRHQPAASPAPTRRPRPRSPTAHIWRSTRPTPTHGVSGYKFECHQARRRHRHRRPVRPGPGRDQRAQDGLRQRRRRRGRPADERRGQGDGADPEPGQPGDHHPDLDQPRHHRPEIRRQYRPAGKAIYFRTVTTDAFQGPNMANYMADTLKVKIGLRARRHRRLRRGPRRRVPGRRPRRRASRCSAATSSTRRRPTTRPS